MHLLVYAFLDFSFEDAGAGGLVVVGYLENVCRIDPVVAATAHDMIAVDIELIYTALSVWSAAATMWVGRGHSRHIGIGRAVDEVAPRHGVVQVPVGKDGRRL